MLGSLPDWLSLGRSSRAERRALNEAKRPQFRAEVQILNAAPWGKRLFITLSGPQTLTLADEFQVTLSVRNEKRSWTEQMLTDRKGDLEYRKRYVQGPFRLVGDGAGPDGQRADPRTIVFGETTQYAIEHVHAPHWYADPHSWGDEFGDLPMRLRLDVSLDTPRRWRKPARQTWEALRVDAPQRRVDRFEY